ncbi:hypothetical protein R1sor_006246 [Riccia sorocarpa]|uniref:Uncharacterized protein n=1 Tax=Riccia sorocarpa TaxID=122646 RepID=A0ABD3HLV2_9MARC
MTMDLLTAEANVLNKGSRTEKMLRTAITEVLRCLPADQTDAETPNNTEEVTRAAQIISSGVNIERLHANSREENTEISPHIMTTTELRTISSERKTRHRKNLEVEAMAELMPDKMDPKPLERALLGRCHGTQGQNRVSRRDVAGCLVG